jgi:hypothetical protein
VGFGLLALSVLLFFWNVYVTRRSGTKVTEEHPSGSASSLEWATTWPPRHNFYRIPGSGPSFPPSTCTTLRSERPAFNLHCPAGQGRVSTGIKPAAGHEEGQEAATHFPGNELAGATSEVGGNHALVRTGVL